MALPGEFHLEFVHSDFHTFAIFLIAPAPERFNMCSARAAVLLREPALAWWHRLTDLVR
jgi:hypothetical protein